MDHLERDALKAAAGRTTAFLWRLVRWLPGGFGTAARPATGDAIGNPLARGLRVMVVDDDPSILGDMHKLLGVRGIAPTLAKDGNEAVALARDGEYDLILMDLQMPVMDGLTATRQIRACERRQARPRAPVLAYTSSALNDDLLQACGVDGVLEKPCRAGALEECLLRWCTPGLDAEFESELSGTAAARPAVGARRRASTERRV
jgi:CheY-like chemotaxis protein